MTILWFDLIVLLLITFFTGMTFGYGFALIYLHRKGLLK